MFLYQTLALIGKMNGSSCSMGCFMYGKQRLVIVDFNLSVMEPNLNFFSTVLPGNPVSNTVITDQTIPGCPPGFPAVAIQN